MTLAEVQVEWPVISMDRLCPKSPDILTTLRIQDRSAPWSEWSWITDPDHPEGTHPKFISAFSKDIAKFEGKTGTSIKIRCPFIMLTCLMTILLSYALRQGSRPCTWWKWKICLELAQTFFVVRSSKLYMWITSMLIFPAVLMWRFQFQTKFNV